MTQKTKEHLLSLTKDLAPDYELLVFDWDGTLFDSTAGIVQAIQMAMADLGLAIPSREQASYVIGWGLQQALSHVAPGLNPALYPVLAQRYQYHYASSAHNLQLFEGMRDMLDTLRRKGHKLAVATGKSRSGLNKVLESLDMQQWFDATRTADETQAVRAQVLYCWAQ